MNVLFVASVPGVTADPPRSRQLFMTALGLPPRLLTEDGLIVGISCAPAFHGEEPA